MKIEHYCRVCGLYSADSLWEEDGTPSYLICSCCGVEAGYEDYTLESTKEYRKEWIENGCSWFDKKRKPLNWDLKKQMENIPEEYK